MSEASTAALILIGIIGLIWASIYIFPYEEKDKWAVPNVSV